MSKIIVISGHPNLTQSVANSRILDKLAERFGDDVAIRRLDELYPNYQIDVNAEQQAMLEADVIVWQFPLYWYSLPALMKKWLDDVFLHGFAYSNSGSQESSVGFAHVIGQALILWFQTACVVFIGSAHATAKAV